MGTVELIDDTLLIRSHIITYGNAASAELTERIRTEIESMWNNASGEVVIRKKLYKVRFAISAEYIPTIEPMDIYSNLDPVNNYFRIEEYVHGNISFVDGANCNTGYFKLENLYPGSTTAAHEYGHTLGLNHPDDLDLRGKGIPGIMYPRGTLVDAVFQYNEAAESGDNTNGGTMHPQFRKVLPADVDALNLEHLSFDGNTAIIGEFTSVWHPDHRNWAPNDPLRPDIMA
jgi:hypothetical protein